MSSKNELDKLVESYFNKTMQKKTSLDKSLRLFCVNTHQSSIVVCGL